MCTYAFSLHPFPLVRAFFKENVTDAFCNLLSIKEPQILQNKETTVQSYWKMLDEDIKKSP